LSALGLEKISSKRSRLGSDVSNSNLSRHNESKERESKLNTNAEIYTERPKKKDLTSKSPDSVKQANIEKDSETKSVKKSKRSKGRLFSNKSIRTVERPSQTEIHKIEEVDDEHRNLDTIESEHKKRGDKNNSKLLLWD
jgi:hypothetical protein